MSSRAVLISIHPRHANKILTGEKKLEFRRRWTPHPVDVLVIYATSPVRKVVAVAKVKNVFVGSRTSLWNIAKNRNGGINRRELFSYLEGKKNAFAIELGDIKYINGDCNPINLFGKDFRPPQSFRYLKEDEYSIIENLMMLEESLSIKNLNDLSDREAINMVGLMIDNSDIFNRADGNSRAIELCGELAKRTLDDRDAALLHYFWANAWSSKRKFKYTEPKSTWEWEQPELLKELLHLRSAISHPGFQGLDKVRRCQILTNTANLFSSIGRSTEALEYWNRALEVIPTFGMALGNRGYGLMSYARTLYERVHAVVMMKFAHDDLRQAISAQSFFESPGYGETKKAMALEADEIAKHVDLREVANIADLEGYSLGRSKKEQYYRKWCLINQLFLSPLNDLGSFAIAAQDIFSLPDIVLRTDEPPTLIGFYNQLKQEYISARYLYYEGKEANGCHFADRGVLLYDTLDYPVYSVSVEKVKASFRMMYSLFDKIAFFINAYWRLEIPESSVNFRTVWYTRLEKGQLGSLRDCFSGYENLPLRGLFWLSKDLLAENSNLADTMEPEAKALKTIRNHLEHKYLKIHDSLWRRENYADPLYDFLRDSLAYSMTREDLEAKALRLIKLARAGLIYLSLAVHREENLRAKERGDIVVVPMVLDTWPDNWKR